MKYSFFKKNILIIVLKLGSTGQLGTRGWNRAELKKKQGKKKLGMTQLPG
jgi:hypothetical protein